MAQTAFAYPRREAKAPKNNWKLTVLLPDRSVRELIEQPAHGTVGFGRAIAARGQVRKRGTGTTSSVMWESTHQQSLRHKPHCSN